MSINLEIMEFYPLEKNEEKGMMSGTLRIRLPDIGINILGIFVSKRRDVWFFALPGRNGIHHETRKSVRYPVITFEDQEKHLALMDAIREKGKAFIENKIAENALHFPVKAPDASKVKPTEKPQPKDKQEATEQKQDAATKAAPSIAAKQWQDPPKRPDVRSRQGGNPFRKDVIGAR